MRSESAEPLKGFQHPRFGMNEVRISRQMVPRALASPKLKAEK
jgi:hypothetical protein